MVRMQKKNVEQGWRSLTWAEVEDWAGLRSVERGREYCRAGKVSWLAHAENGDVLAWVRGGERYACRVSLQTGPAGAVLRGRCTCPMQKAGCKHCVAAVLAYLDALRHGREVPLAEPDAAWPLDDVLSDVAILPFVSADQNIDDLRATIDARLKWPTPTDCETMMPALRRLRSMLVSARREAEWEEYANELRTKHWRQPRLSEVLDRLQTRRIIPA